MNGPLITGEVTRSDARILARMQPIDASDQGYKWPLHSVVAAICPRE